MSDGFLVMIGYSGPYVPSPVLASSESKLASELRREREMADRGWRVRMLAEKRAAREKLQIDITKARAEAKARTLPPSVAALARSGSDSARAALSRNGRGLLLSHRELVSDPDAALRESSGDAREPSPREESPALERVNPG